MAWITNGYAQGPRTAVSVGASPFVFINTESVPVCLFVSAGTVVTIEFSRDGVVFDGVGLLGGQFSLNPGDRIRTTYTLAPTMVYYPR